MKESECLIFDTEQGRKHAYQVRRKIFELTDTNVPVFYLRGKSPKERKDIIYATLKYWPHKIRLVVIDGIRDLLSNINDPDQSTDLIVWLERLTLEFGVHVVNVLHMNKNDTNARGHVGSELANKAQTTFELELDQQAGVTVVKCADSRDKPFEDFAFTHGENDLPVIVSVPLNGNTLTEPEEKKRLKFAFEDGPFKRTEAIEAIKSHFECGREKADKLLARFNRNSWIIKNGKAHSKDSVYKLNF
jgi:hypothetical protein